MQLKHKDMIGKRLLCRYYGKQDLFVLVLKEISPSGNHALASIDDGDPQWSTYNLIEVVEILD